MQQEDEYVIYNTSQQRLRYLVEFTINSETPDMNFVLEDVDMDIERRLPARITEMGKLIIFTIWWPTRLKGQ